MGYILYNPFPPTLPPHAFTKKKKRKKEKKYQLLIVLSYILSAHNFGLSLQTNPLPLTRIG